MKDDFEKDEEFDPTKSEEFLKNLELALNPTEEEQEQWEPKVDEDAAWVNIEDSVVEKKEEELQNSDSGTTETSSNPYSADDMIDNNSENSDTGKTENDTEEMVEYTDLKNPENDEQEDAIQKDSSVEDDIDSSANGLDSQEDLPTLDISDSLFQVDSDDHDFEEKEPAEDVLLGINAALAEQIEQQFGKSDYNTQKEPGKFKKFLNGIPKWTKVLAIVLFALILFFGLLFGTSAGRGLVSRIAVELLFSGINSPDPGSDFLVTVTPAPTEVVDPNVSPEPTEAIPSIAIPTGEAVEDDSVINILLLGEENLFNASRGRTDAILVASLDKDGGPLKLISFMRDMYVSIPGYGNNKLNAAYVFGGSKLMMETIETNFKIKLDGYVLVNFSGFEEIIDQLGGIEISLTVQESEYLNTTKYISKVEERNTVPGTQLLTGSQVLGYCRVRKVKTANGLDSDFGRTYRQRLVLQKLFERYKEKNYTELLSLMSKCLGYVTAPDTLKSTAAECLQVVIENKMFDLDTMQMPVNGHFENKIINNNDVIVVWPDNNTLLHDFIYNNEE